MKIRRARAILGKEKIIGISCHSLRQALAAQAQGADYIGIGPIFPTATKPRYAAIGLSSILQLAKRIRIPFFAIGNINSKNLNLVYALGAKRVALCRAILKEKNEGRATTYFSNRLRKLI
jgi:thiamine-phosphate pyrophosphorylase